MTGARVLALILAASAVGIPTRAAAQCRLCSTPTTTREDSATADDIKLEVETTLDFDRLIVAGTGTGDAVLRPDGSALGTGSVNGMAPRAKVATVSVHGQPGRVVRIDLPRQIELTSLGGGRLTFDEVVTDAADVPRLDSAGNLTFHIGGRLRFMGGEDGDYRGDLSVTVDYQ